MAIWRDDVKAALESIGGQGALGEIYEAVKRIRDDLPPSWEAIVRRELEYNSSDSESYQHKHDLFYSVGGIGKGVWGLRAGALTPSASDVGDAPLRAETIVYRILRDTKLARAIKKLHQDKCQVCGVTLQTLNGISYSEAHHIKPLGAPHHGPDIRGNILVLCPNHHALIDLGGLALTTDHIRSHPDHQIEISFLDYHNNTIMPLAIKRQ